MSSFWLKVIAMGTMVIDHVGAILFPQYLMLRIIGRISFPIFCFLLTEGFIHTSNRQRYAVRLGVFALASQPAYTLAFHHTLFSLANLNIFFTLLLGFMGMWIFEYVSAKKGYLLGAFGVFVTLLIAYSLPIDYGVYGVLTIYCFYFFKKQKQLSFGAFAATTGVCSFWYVSTVQLWSLGALALIAFYNGKRGKYTLKYFFYVFYPAHLLVLYFIYILVH